MNNDATEAALGLLGLSPTNLQPPSPIIPLKRKQCDQLQPPSTPTTIPLQPQQQPEDGLNEGVSCICGFTYDDGFSIACDECSRWVHGACFGINHADEVKGCEWKCWVCVPREVDREGAIRKQLEKQKGMMQGSNNNEGAGGGGGGGGNSHHKPRRKQSPSGERKHRRPSAVANGVDNNNTKRKRRPSIINASNSHNSSNHHPEDEHVDIGEPWTHSYVPISQDIIPHHETREKLRRHAQHWRGITAISSQQESLTTIRPVNVPHSPYSNPAVRPPTYALHTTAPIHSEQLIAPYTSTITPSATYLSDPLNAYAHLGMPKPYVHLVGPPLDVALDSRFTGDKSRFARNGCRPNAVLRPMLCCRSPPTNTNAHSPNVATNQFRDETLSFGVFAIRDLKANEEVVLGWEWDDGNAVHSLPAAIKSPHMFRCDSLYDDHDDSPEQLEYLRHQYSNILHALTSTFTTCACGAKAKDCALNLMAAFVDGEVPLASPGGGPSKEVKVDLGPLVGVERGFRTREIVPFSGGMSGVEMCVDEEDGSGGVSVKGKGKTKGKEKERVVDGQSTSPILIDEEMDAEEHSITSPIRTIKRLPKKRTITSEPEYPPDIVPPPVLPPRPPEHAGDESGGDSHDGLVVRVDEPFVGKDGMDVDADAGVVVMEQEEDEERMPPKMRKRWIHKSLNALREANRRSVEKESSESGSPGVVGLGLGIGSGVEGEERGGGRESQNNRMAIDTLVNPQPHPHPRPDCTNMPPPPMPAALDPTTISSISSISGFPLPSTSTSSTSSSITLTHPRAIPSQSLFSLDHHSHPNGATSPSTSFAKLSLLSPVVIHQSPPLGNDNANPTSISSLPTPTPPSLTPQGAILRGFSGSPTQPQQEGVGSSDSGPSTLLPSNAVDHGSPRPQEMEQEPALTTTTTTDGDSERGQDHKEVRFASPPSVDLPASLQRRSSPARSSTPPLAPSGDANYSQPSSSADDRNDAEIHVAPLEDAPMKGEESVSHAPSPKVDDPASSSGEEQDEMVVDVSFNEQPVTESSSEVTEVAQATLNPSEELTPTAADQSPLPSVYHQSSIDQPQLTSQAESEPNPDPDPRRPTPPPPQPVQKVKLSLKDFALRRKKQREEEMAKSQNSPVVGGGLVEIPPPNSLVPPPSNSVTLPGDEGTPRVNEIAQEKENNEVVDGSGDSNLGAETAAESIDTTLDVDVHSDNQVALAVDGSKSNININDDRSEMHAAAEDSLPRRRSESHSHSDPSVHTPPSSTPPLTPRSPPGHSPPPSTVSRSRSRSPQDLRGKENPRTADGGNNSTLQAKIEIFEQGIPNEVPDRTKHPTSQTPEPAPSYRPFHEISRAPPSIPPSEPAPRGHSNNGIPPYADTFQAHHRRPSHEDGEILSTRSDASPPPLPAGPKAHNGINGSYGPRVHTPPTGPRSYHSGPSPPSFVPSSSGGRRPSIPPPQSYNQPSLASSSSSAGSKRPPIAPRASRGYGGQSYQPNSYAPPPPRSMSGQQYIPRGPSADRDRDWDRERGWPRVRGRGGTWGR